MNRILRRPMFRMGGSTGTGIMSGLDKPRKRYATGSSLMPGTVPGFLTDFSLNLLSTPPTGNIFQTAATAAKEPLSRFQAAQFKKKQAEDKFAKDLALVLAKPQKPTLRQGVDKRTGERGFFTSEEILNNPNIIPPDNRMGFRINTKTNTIEQVPITEIEKGRENETKAQALGTQYNILTSLVGDMKTRLPDTPSGVVGFGFGAVEGVSDQLAQLAESLGVKDGLVIENQGTIDKYLKDKGFTEKAQSAATMRASVINLGYALAKIAEPDNPRLSEGDIIRQLNRINFGASRNVFGASLDQILKEELIRASAEIKGLKLNPNDFIGIKKEEGVEGKKGTTDNNPAGLDLPGLN